MIDVKRMRQQQLQTRVHGLIEAMIEGDLHAKRILSLTHATIGVLHGAALGVTAIGRAMALARGVKAKHAIKQVDRLLSNQALDVCELFKYWVPYVRAQRQQILVSIDWTDFDKDKHATCALNMITDHGRATPLMWKTVDKKKLKGWRNAHEDGLLLRLRERIPKDVDVTILGDRGFGDTKLYALLQQIGFGYIIRFRGNIVVEDQKGQSQAAASWAPDSGRSKTLRLAKVTHQKALVPTVICLRSKGMKAAWCLAVGDPKMKGKVAVQTYSKRFTCEETFRDVKDLRFGMGLSSVRISDVNRRDRVLLLSALAIGVLTLLGAAGEQLGLDRQLKANTVKRRTHSLFFQGCYYYAAMPMMPEGDFKALAIRFGELLREQQVTQEVFGLI